MSIPGSDELEISVFGRGSGEAIAVHVGEGKWLLIDSLLTDAKTPVALDYLEDLGVDLSSVEAILLTHWHDDHIAGASQLVQKCVNAVVAIPQTLLSDEFLCFVDEFEGGSEEFGSGVEELRRVLRELKARQKHPKWSIAQRTISGSATGPYDFEALSPSDADVSEFLSSVKRWIEVSAVGGRIPTPDRNDSSVAAVVRMGERLLLFGADLEVSKPDSGWQGVHASAWNKRGQADFVKIPHHGSKNAHFPAMWSEMCIAAVHAVLTPWNKNKGLPTEADVNRILSVTTNAYAASRPMARKALKRLRSVDSMLRDKKIQLFQITDDVGQVRFRGPSTGPCAWNIDLYGTGSSHLSDLLAA